MEILSKEHYSQFEEFNKTHKNGNFMQSLSWANLKSNWIHEIVVSRDANGNIKGGASILMQSLPVLGSKFIYCPRGPVYDYDDKETLADLLLGIKALSKKYGGFLFKMDPGVFENDADSLKVITDLGFKYEAGRADFETMQTRYNYGLTSIEGKSEDEVLMSFSQKTRYNIRVAMKHGVQCRICGKESMDDFMRLMRITAKRDNFVCRAASYYEKMLDVYGENIRMYICYHNDIAVSAALCIRYGGKCWYVFGASDNAHRNVMPNYLMQWEMIKWAIEGGCYLYDFLGIPVNADPESPMIGVYRFKKGFNGEILALAGEFDYVLNPAVNFAFNSMKKLKRGYHQVGINFSRFKNKMRKK